MFSPNLLFDKSALQALNPDEAALLDGFYRTLVTPVFFYETLADLSKPENRGRRPEEVVGSLVHRTPSLHSAVAATHLDLIKHDLLVGPVAMDGRPPVPGGRVIEKDGKLGLVYEPSPEVRALARWQRGQFTELERELAAGWRATIASLDLRAASEPFGTPPLRAAFHFLGDPASCS